MLENPTILQREIFPECTALISQSPTLGNDLVFISEESIEYFDCNSTTKPIFQVLTNQSFQRSPLVYIYQFKCRVQNLSAGVMELYVYFYIIMSNYLKLITS